VVRDVWEEMCGGEMCGKRCVGRLPHEWSVSKKIESERCPALRREWMKRRNSHSTERCRRDLKPLVASLTEKREGCLVSTAKAVG
jgi:hypothetical protein